MGLLLFLVSFKFNVFLVGVLFCWLVVGWVGWLVFLYEFMVWVSLWLLVMVVVVLFGWGSW